MRYLLFIGLLLSSSAQAESTMNSYRCGNGLVQKGMSMQQVHDLCGEFDSYKVWEDQYTDLKYIDRNYNAPVKTVRYDRWTYSDYGRFDVHILFREGRVVKMVQGKR